MHRWTAAILVALLASLGAAAVPASKERAAGAARAGSPAACVGPGAGTAEARALVRGAEAHPFYVFARSLVGAPARCRVSSSSSEGGAFGAVHYTYADGSSLDIEAEAPETSDVRLVLTKGFADPLQARRFLRSYAEAIGFRIDWEGTPESQSDGRAGTRRLTFWDPAPGMNAGAELTFRGDVLVGIGFHAAL